MTDPSKIPTSELIAARDLSAATYMASYLRLMFRELDVPDNDHDAIREYVLRMVVPMNHATRAIFFAFVKDTDKMEEEILNFRACLHAL